MIPITEFPSISDAMQFASDRSAAGQSTKLFVPSGTHDFSGITTPDDLVLVGEGRGSIITGNPTFQQLDANVLGGGAESIFFESGITLSRARNLMFSRCHFNDVITTHPTFLNHYNTFLHCFLFNNKGNNCFHIQGQSHFNKVISCRMTNNNAGVASVLCEKSTGLAAAGGWSFIGCSFEGSADEVAIDWDGDYSTFMGNWFEPAATQSQPTVRFGPNSQANLIFIGKTSGDFQYVDDSTSSQQNHVIGRGNMYKEDGAPQQYKSAQQWGTHSGTTDATGLIDWWHDIWDTPTQVTLDLIGGIAGHRAEIVSIDAESIYARVVDATGATVNSAAVSISWFAQM